eukprot:2849525-Pyramimonas_sp.AAC.1
MFNFSAARSCLQCGGVKGTLTALQMVQLTISLSKHRAILVVPTTRGGSRPGPGGAEQGGANPSPMAKTGVGRNSRSRPLAP